MGYFQQEDIPPAMLMKVKFEELIVNITTANSNVPLACYFKEICTNKNISIREVMESNFMYNMTLEEYARICGRSLSSFRRDFKSIFGISPGSWLTKKRLEYGKYLLETTDRTIEAITFESGFANASHFIRIFKTKYGKSPIKYKK